MLLKPVSNDSAEMALEDVILHSYTSTGGGGGFFHSKGTWGCAAYIAKGILFGNFSRLWSRQGYAFWQFWSKNCKSSVISVRKPNSKKISVLKMQKFGKFCLENANSGHF